MSYSGVSFIRKRVHVRSEKVVDLAGLIVSIGNDVGPQAPRSADMPS